MRTVVSRALAVLAFAFVQVLHAHSQGYIVPNGVRYVTYNPTLGAIIHVLQDPTNGDFTGFSLTPQLSDAFLYDPLYNPFTGKGMRTFLVSENDPISLKPILANSYTELTFPHGYVFAQGASFYLGFYTGDTPSQNGIFNDPLFGWGEFLNNGGVIQLLDSALEYGGSGIYVGTQEIIGVPEPSVLGLLSTSAALFFGLRILPHNPSNNRSLARAADVGVEGIPVGAAEGFQGRGRRWRSPLRRRQHHRPTGIRKARLPGARRHLAAHAHII